MPLYYFHIYDDEITVDEEGQELPDAAAARDMAIRSARELICDDVRGGRVKLSHRIEIEDQGRRPVLSLTYAEAVSVDP